MSPPGGIVHQRLCSLLMYIRKPLIFGLSGASWRKYWVESHCFLGEIVSFDIARVTLAISKDTISPRKQWLSTQYFRHDAPDRPNINGFRIYIKSEHNLWCTIPPGGDIFGHKAALFVVRSCIS